jgi:hypothetical protein
MDLHKVLPMFPRLPVPDLPGLENQTWESCHRGSIGGGGLYLAAELAMKMELTPEMQVLELGAGQAAASLFVARQYGVSAFAVDNEVRPGGSRRTAQGAPGSVLRVKADVRALPFAPVSFDAVFAINSYFYFGTDDFFLPYLIGFMRQGATLAFASPCYSRELTPDTPEIFLYDGPDYLESRLVHSPGRWLSHLQKTGLTDVLTCAEHPLGREIWLDDTRWLLEQRHPLDMEPDSREMVRQQMEMLLADEERFVTYMVAILKKR